MKNVVFVLGLLLTVLSPAFSRYPPHLRAKALALTFPANNLGREEKSRDVVKILLPFIQSHEVVQSCALPPFPLRNQFLGELFGKRGCRNVVVFQGLVNRVRLF